MADRFWKLTKDEVASMQKEAREAAALRADLDRRCLEATEVICGLSDAMSVEEAQEEYQKAADVLQKAPVPAYIAPVKRWAGGPPESDAWYWDRP